MNYSYISNVLSLSLSFYCNSLCFLTNLISSPHTCLSGFFIPSFFYFSSSYHLPSSPWYSLNLIDSFTLWFWFHLLSCTCISPFPTFLCLFPSFFLINYSVSSLHFLHPLFTGILETDITFLIIFSMVFLLSCYFACKYCLFHLPYLSFSLFSYDQASFFWLSKPAAVIKCPFPQVYYKIYMFSWWERSKSSCFLW